jgi:hypothetical protein
MWALLAVGTAGGAVVLAGLLARDDSSLGRIADQAQIIGLFITGLHRRPALPGACADLRVRAERWAASFGVLLE